MRLNCVISIYTNYIANINKRINIFLAITLYICSVSVEGDKYPIPQLLHRVRIVGGTLTSCYFWKSTDDSDNGGVRAYSVSHRKMKVKLGNLAANYKNVYLVKRPVGIRKQNLIFEEKMDRKGTDFNCLSSP